MDFESKVTSREISQLLWEMDKTVGTAESCTGGRIAEVIMSVPGASKYFKGGIISYVDEVKQSLLGVSPQVLEEQTAVCEDVARQMVVGACRALNVDYAISATGIAGPGGGTKEIPVGTIWLAYGSKDDIRTSCQTEDEGRDVNLLKATNRVLKLFLEYLKEQNSQQEE